MNSTTAPDTVAAEVLIRQPDSEWSKAAEMRDLNGIVDMYAEDVVVLAPNVPRQVGRQAGHELNRQMLAIPGFSVKWRADKVEVARSGDMAYVLITYDLTVNDAKGVPTTDKGKGVEIWKKQTDGSWKVAVEIFNSDLPLKPAEPPAANNDAT